MRQLAGETRTGLSYRRTGDQVTIRTEQPVDIPAIRLVNRLAFQQDQEGHIVDALRAAGAALLSLVAVVNGEVIGHILYSPASIGTLTGAALGPMAVRPDCQRQGVGSRLVEAGTAILQASGCPFIVVVGHEAYYPRFGFTAAASRGISCGWDVPDDAFMIRVLDERVMQGVSGLTTFRHEFSTIS